MYSENKKIVGLEKVLVSRRQQDGILHVSKAQELVGAPVVMDVCV